jgi:hypothetical protein
MSKLDGDNQLRFAQDTFTQLWWRKSELNAKSFSELCWGLTCLAAGIQYALNDIHTHVRQPPAGAAPRALGQRVNGG